jgi:4-amino-4-deoxy-L-arabinose transferase-like glycosyltransferase
MSPRGLAARPVGRRDHLVGFALAATYVAILVLSARGLGYARDEGFYFRAAESYAGWFEQIFRDPHAAMQRSSIDSFWGVNHEHPALIKSLFALSWTLLFKKLHLFSEAGTSFRFGGMLMAGGALWLLYIWGARARSRTVGLVAALAFASMPRIFYHSHLDCFDVPIATMWTLCAYAYWRSLEKGGVRWAILAGVTFGLALDTKHNSWFLPFAVVGHTLVTRHVGILHDLKNGRVRAPLALFTMATIGPAIFVALWPWLWFDTAARLAGYVEFHTNHDYYNIVFLGTTYWKPPMPRTYAWVMTLATVPAITLVLFGIGLASRAWARLGWLVSARAPLPVRDRAGTDLLWAIGLAIAYAPWLSPNTPIFGGTKHWITAYPFLCLFAGCGFEAVARQIRRSFARKLPAAIPVRAVDLVVGAAIFSAPIAETAHSHPWGLSNYTPLVGGAPGAASLGLNRQFWGFTTGAVTDWLDRHVPPGGSVYIHDTAWDSWEMLHRDGRLASGINGVWQPSAGQFALYHHEEHMEQIEYQIWVAYGTTAPADIGVYDGVPIVYVYARPGAARP